LIVMGLALIVILTAVTGYFVTQEFAYVAVDRGRLRSLADTGDRAAGRALRVTERLSFALSGAQLGITVTVLLVGYVAEPYLGQGLAELLESAGVPSEASLPASIAVTLLLSTMVQMVLGELAPKNWAIARPEGLARALSRSTLIYLAVAGPVIRVFDAAANRLLRRVGIEPVEELPHGATIQELDRIVAASTAEGHLDEDTSRLLVQGLDFRTRTASEVMTPRVDLVTVRADDPATRVVELLDTGHSRFPVVGSGVDDVVGVVSLAEIRDVPPSQRAATPVAAVASAPVLVPASATLPVVLERLRAERRQLACVVDEYGGFAGVITLEDIAEELVGAIRDEDDLPEDAVEAQRDGSWLVPGRWRLDEITDATGVELPDNDTYDTISGLVLALLGRVPVPGDVVETHTPTRVDEDGEEIPSRRVRLTVVSVRRHVPHTIRLALLDEMKEGAR